MNVSMAESGTRRMGMAEALRDAMRVAMKSDPTVFLIGEDIGVKGGFGGGFTVTLGLSDEFDPARVVDTPISEAAIVGAAVGAAMAGMRPVAEMQYGDFVFCAMDQVVNQAAKMHYMSNGQVRVPMVLRLPVGASQRDCLRCVVELCARRRHGCHVHPGSNRTHRVVDHRCCAWQHRRASDRVGSGKAHISPRCRCLTSNCC